MNLRDDKIRWNGDKPERYVDEPLPDEIAPMVHSWCATFETSIAEVRSNSKAPPICRARERIAVALQGRGWSTTEIGRLLHKGHSAVVGMLRRMEAQHAGAGQA